MQTLINLLTILKGLPMFICHLLHKSVHFFLQNKSTLVYDLRYKSCSVLHAEAKLHFQTDQRYCDIESKKGMSVTDV